MIFSHQSKVDKEKGKGKGKETQEALAFSGGKALGPLGPFSNKMGFCLLPKITVENAGICFSLQRDLQTGLDLYTIAKKKHAGKTKIPQVCLAREAWTQFSTTWHMGCFVVLQRVWAHSAGVQMTLP